jgi:membrane protease YdiL (CAAX protease family)
MKLLTPLSPYLAVGIGMFWFHQAWVALLGFHFVIVLSLLLAKPHLSIKVLFKSNDFRWVILSVLLCGSSGVSLYVFWSTFEVVTDLPAQIKSLGLTSSTWPVFITYFVLVNPLIEEYFWRGYLGNPTKRLYISDFLYSGFHGLVLMNKMQAGAIIFSLIVLVITGWFWRQVARADGGLLAPVLGHMAADFTILVAVYRMSI